MDSSASFSVRLSPSQRRSMSLRRSTPAAHGAAAARRVERAGRVDTEPDRRIRVRAGVRGATANRGAGRGRGDARTHAAEVASVHAMVVCGSRTRGGVRARGMSEGTRYGFVPFLRQRATEIFRFVPGRVVVPCDTRMAI